MRAIINSVSLLFVKRKTGTVEPYNVLLARPYAAFFKQFRVAKFKKNEVILHQDDEPQTAYVIKEGVVKMYNITSEGDEKPISFDVSGDLFPAEWVFSRAERTLFYYEAFTDCSLYVVPKDVYQQFLHNNPIIMRKAFDLFVSRMVGYTLRVNALAQSRAADKLLHTIHYLCLRFGKEIKKDFVRIRLPLTQQELANFMGLTRETTTVELSKLKQLGVISYCHQTYSVRTNKLNELLDEEYNPGLDIT